RRRREQVQKFGPWLLLRAGGIDLFFRPFDEMTQTTGPEAAARCLTPNLFEIAVGRGGRIAVEAGVGVGADECHIGARRMLTLDPPRQRRQKIEALTLRRRDLRAWAPAPVEDEGERLGPLDRKIRDPAQRVLVVRLFPLERPGVERPHERVRARRETRRPG